MRAATKLSRGAIGWMASNRVAANLIMVCMLVGGLIVGLTLKQEVFPAFDLDEIQIRVAYPGATPEEVENGIVLAIEEAIQSLDGVKEVSSVSSESSAVVNVRLEETADAQTVLQDVKSAVDRISTFPVESERPQIALLTIRSDVLTLVLSGADDPLVLREWSEIVRDELLQAQGITMVELDNVLDHEVLVEISQSTLRRYGLTMQDVAARIAETALELGGGLIRATSGDIMVRLNERRKTAHDFANIALLTTATGSRLLLSDVARVFDGFEDTTRHSEYNGQAAQLLTVYRIGSQTPTSVAAAALQVAERMNHTMPGTLQIHTLRNSAEVFSQRADLLLNNAWFGMLLVFVSLALFLEMHLAFWVSLGIPVSFFGSFMILAPLGVSINMMSMFAFLITLGIVVDDAIVVGDNIRAYRERGFKNLDAAILGTREVGLPVVFSVLTNMVAFLPMLFIPGVMGKIWGVIPTVVIAVFTCSLVESLFVLPCHLANERGPQKGAIGFMARLGDLQKRFSQGFMRFVEYRYGPLILWVCRNRYTVVAASLALLLVCFGYVFSGRMGFDLMPRVDADYSHASATLPTGSAEAQIFAVKEKLLAGAQQVVRENGGEALSTGVYALLRGNEITVRLYLTPPDERPIDTAAVTALWRQAVGEVPGVETLTFTADQGGPGSGKGLTIRLLHRDTTTLETAAAQLGAMLANYEILGDIDTGISRTKRQFELRLKPLAQQLGLSARGIAAQVRAAFEGVVALRQQRGRNEVSVRVRLPQEDRVQEATFENLVLRAPDGREVLLRDVVDIEDGRAYSFIRHTGGRRTATVTASVTPSSATGMIMQTVKNDIMPELLQDYPGLSWEYAGRQADMQDSMQALYIGLVMAILAIYALLAVPFKSYTQPLIIMAAIPFGAVGAILGHLLMGYSLSIISVVGIVALAGVVVNDSLVLIDFANRRRLEGLGAEAAIRMAGIQRFRPILLTTLTTFAGLAPMIFETSRQARMLIPVALSLGFGILFATVICLIIVPALYMVLEDFHTHNPPLG